MKAVIPYLNQTLSEKLIQCLSLNSRVLRENNQYVKIVNQFNKYE